MRVYNQNNFVSFIFIFVQQENSGYFFFEKVDCYRCLLSYFTNLETNIDNILQKKYEAK